MVAIASIAPYVAVPTVATTVGGVIASLRPPSARVASAIQHFAAGAVLAAVAAELLPEALRARDPATSVAGFAIALALMLGIERLARLLGAGREESQGLLALTVILAVDTLIDGILLGIGFAAGIRQGTILALALSVETLSLGLSVAAALGMVKASRRRIVTTSVVLSALFAAGGLGGWAILSNVGGAALDTLLAFGAAVLLYLTAEELLVEAHEGRETPVARALFFAGFLLLVMMDVQV